MKKILFTIRIVIFVSLICIFIIGCSKVDKSINTVYSAPLNNDSFENNTPRPSVSETITQTQSSNSPLTPTSNPTISPAISPSLSDESITIDAYKLILQNKISFYSPYDDKNIFLKDFLSYGGAGYDAELGLSHFAILDMDGDKINEVVLDLSFFGREGTDLCEVLHFMNGTVYGYLLTNRGLEELKSDGTFIYSAGAGDWGFATLKFTSDNYEYSKLGYCESNANGELYFIDNNTCTEEAFSTFCNEQEDKAETKWYEFSQETVKAQLTSTQAPWTQTNLKASDAAKIAADYDDTGAPYFITYDYDATDYLVSAYESQQGTGDYSGGGALYLINKATGKVSVNADVDINKVNFSNYLTVYSKLSSKIIE